MSSDDAFLAEAAAIGRRLLADAVWYERRCSWMGAVEDPRQPWRVEYRPLGPSVYGGTAGVGLFLAQLGAVTGDGAVCDTARAALGHAVARTLETAPADGFHAGSIGVAWTAARTARLLDDDELRAAARLLIDGPRPRGGPDRSPDVSMGCAGAVLGLLALGAELDDASLVADARHAGEHLLGSATITPHGWSWAIPGRRHPQNLCGVAHGAAGIGWALLELFEATADDRFGAAAAGAFAYERSWLDTNSGTWPDLRVPGQRRGAPRPIPSPTLGTWCYGEGGIALTRLRAAAVLGSEPHLHDAQVALKTTRRFVDEALPYDIADLTLCHGLAGAADALLSGAGLLSDLDQPEELAAVAIERGDTSRTTTPGLFRGSSGIGWWLLRLHDPTTPSPLTLPFPRLTAVIERA